ncbi:MAG: N-acetylmuramoyl-L-alanine amidase [Armatimonadetes bacterium]|nr:N-acetylmuramoyl-L-alanine amidase [Armatimonadota bacterium]
MVLDPGHGGADAGAVRNGVCEAALTYRTAVELADAIRRQGGRVMFTVRSRTLAPQLVLTEPAPERPRDAVLAVNGQPLRLRRGDSPRFLWQRAAVARRLWLSCSPSVGGRAVLFFLSLHYDDFHRSSVQGGLVCVDRRMKSVPTLARLLAAQFCADGLARPDIYHGLRGVAASRLGVLDPKYNPVPQRALLELATISNEADARCAADPDWRRGIIARITDALIAAHQGVQ